MKVKAFFILIAIACVGTMAFAKTDPTKWCGTKGPMMTEYFIKQHEFRERERQFGPVSAAQLKRQNTDVGNIAVIKASPRNFITANFFDLLNKKITFTRAATGTFNIKVAPTTLGPSQGTAMAFKDDDTKQVNFTSGFSFPYYGTTYNS